MAALEPALQLLPVSLELLDLVLQLLTPSPPLLLLLLQLLLERRYNVKPQPEKTISFHFKMI